MPEPVDLRLPENQGRPITSFRAGELITGLNGTDTVWRVIKPGVLTKVKPDG